MNLLYNYFKINFEELSSYVAFIIGEDDANVTGPILYCFSSISHSCQDHEDTGKQQRI